MNTASIAPAPRTAWLGHLGMFLLALPIVVAAEWIGTVRLAFFGLQLVLQPLLWALLLGMAVGVVELQHTHGAARQAALQRQLRASAILPVGLLLFLAKLGLTVGGMLPKLAAAGPLLLLQEIGHFFGTMALALPIALLLGIKREAIGATFSRGGETSLAIIAERYGMASPEGRGVVAEWLTGLVLGSVFIVLLAGLMASLGVFDARALAMGAGVGSATMMAAASSAIVAIHPEQRDEIATFAAAANLLTTTLGPYVSIFVTLPLAQFLYRKLEPVLGSWSRSVSVPDSGESEEAQPRSAPGTELVTLFASAALALAVGHWMTGKLPPLSGIPGFAVLLVVVLAGRALKRAVKLPIMIVCWVSALGVLATAPFWPGAAAITAATRGIDFLALAPPITAFAGYSVARQLPALGRLGWRIVVVALLANAGTFLGATMLAQFAIHHA